MKPEGQSLVCENFERVRHYVSQFPIAQSLPPQKNVRLGGKL